MMPDLPKFVQWLLDLVAYIPKMIFQLITDALIGLIDSIFALCGQCSLSSINTSLAGLPDGIIWLLGWFNFGTGLTIIGSAYLVRFLIRRLPLIG